MTTSWTFSWNLRFLWLLKIVAYLNFCKGSASDPSSSSLGRTQPSNLQDEVKFQLRYHNVNDGSSKFYKSFRVNSRCMCTITPIFAIASRLQQCVTQCSWSFVGTLWINIILRPCDWSRVQECRSPLVCRSQSEACLMFGCFYMWTSI